MCGILGTINKVFDISELDLIGHRGPDDRGVVTSEISGSIVQLGHVRLSIQDLSPSGHQPMYSSCGKYLIVFNGEIYNHLELRARLPSVEFNGHSDTETIVNYLSVFGIDAIEDFNGIFSLALLDVGSGQIHLVRDRFGVKPLYYSLQGNELSFCSEIRPLSSSENVDIDLDNLATLLKLRYNPSPFTIYKEIKKVRPGHILSFDLNSQEICHRSYSRERRICGSFSFDQALIEYGQRFEEAVRRQLIGDVEVGVLLSGGIDSALVAYFAQKFSAKPIKTFTVGFDETDETDELIDARRTAALLGTEHHEVKVTQSEFEEAFKVCVEIVEEPLATTSIVPMYFLNKLVSNKGIKVVLTGQGADEPLGGYTRYRGEQFYGKVPPFLFSLLAPFGRFIKNESVYRAVHALSEVETVKRWSKIYALFRDSEIKSLIGREDTLSESLISYWYELLGLDKHESVCSMMSADARMNLSDDLLLYTDKISMHFSIESRVPILDNDLMKFSESLPASCKISGGQGKYIHKKFAETVLPSEIVYRKKKGFKSPTKKWFQGQRGREYLRMLMDDSGAFSRIFNLVSVRKFFELHLNNKRNLEKQLFLLVSIFYWLQSTDSCRRAGAAQGAKRVLGVTGESFHAPD